EAFSLKYIEIGNEASGQVYADNYKLFYKAIKAKYPNLHIISNFDKVDGGTVEITDHHKYGSPESFFKMFRSTIHTTAQAPVFTWANMVLRPTWAMEI
ncbi:MAG: hypothetical protein HC905_23770, partial [Bacteroidales bacterium]|nr:hypothetical protein [Bacteroidales bacterium]